MSENLYSWHNEIMTNLEMREIEREIEDIRLIKDANLGKPGLIERIATSLGNTLTKRSQELHEQRKSPRQAYQNTSCRIAS